MRHYTGIDSASSFSVAEKNESLSKNLFCLLNHIIIAKKCKDIIIDLCDNLAFVYIKKLEINFHSIVSTK